MSPPAEAVQRSLSDQERNKKYLNLIFEHSKAVIDKVLKSRDGNYALTYDDLVHMEGHGTPSAVRRNAGIVPPMPLLPSPGQNRNAKNIVPENKARIERAQKKLIESFPKGKSSLSEYWKSKWGSEYHGFLDVQKEIGALRDDIIKGESGKDISRADPQYLCRELNFMLRSNVGEWYKTWGELDLHRLSIRDALEVVRKYIKETHWSEVRIVAGQRPHVGKDHTSKGILYRFIHDTFEGFSTTHRPSGPTATGNYSEEQLNMIRDIQRYSEKNRIKCWFYSKGAAVYLRKPRRVH